MTVRLKRLKIHQFRDLAPGTELHFGDGWNVVLGRNATGKTTLLHLISMALRGDFTELEGEAFSLECDLLLGAWEVFLALRSERMQTGAEAPRTPRGRPTAHVHTTSFVLRCGTERLVCGAPHPAFPDLAPTPIPWMDEDPPLSPTRQLDSIQFFQNLAGRDGDGLRELAFVKWAYRFDEALELFQKIHGHAPRGPSLPQEALEAWEDEEFALLGLVPPAASIRFDPQRDLSLALTFEQCTHLTEALPLLDGRQFTAGSLVANVEREPYGTLTSFDKLTVLMHRNDGNATSVESLSFGQRRLFAFAWYLDTNAGPVVADELVNGMHYEWIEWCVEALKGRQVFVTAQNPLLLDHLTFHEVDDVRRGFVLCRAAREGDTRVVRWTHPSDEQAHEFLRAYENGVMRVHEILRTEGLW